MMQFTAYEIRGDDNLNSESCFICLDPMNKNEGITKSCKSGCTHLVHSACWRRYMLSVPENQQCCPMCRNKDTQWPDDDLTRIAIHYADPVEDIMEKGPSWGLGLTVQYQNEHYYLEDETCEEFTSRMEESLKEALEQGATDPEIDSDDDSMPDLISDDENSMPDLISEDEGGDQDNGGGGGNGFIEILQRLMRDEDEHFQMDTMLERELLNYFEPDEGL